MFRYISIFGERIGAFPVCSGIGVLCSILLMLQTLKKLKVSEEEENRFLCPLPFALIFSFGIAYLSDVINRGSMQNWIQNPGRYGITFYGFFLGLLLFGTIYARMVKIPPFYLLNIWIPPLAAGQAWGRIGCFLGGCCFGMPCSFGLVYPEGSLPFQRYGATSLFPVQLIEAGYLFITSLILFRVIPFRRRFLWYLLLVGTGRFVLEFFRGDNRGNLGNCMFLSPGQIISLCLVVFSMATMFFLHCKFFRKKELYGRKN